MRPGVPAERAAAGHLGVDPDGLAHVRALLGLAHVVVVDPFEAVAGDLPAGLLMAATASGLRSSAVATPKTVTGRLRSVKMPPQPPEPGAGAVFVDRLHVHVALARPGLCADDLGQERLRRRIAVQDAVLAALLVVDDELQATRASPGQRGCGGLRRSRRDRGDIALQPRESPDELNPVVGGPGTRTPSRRHRSSGWNAVLNDGRLMRQPAAVGARGASPDVSGALNKLLGRGLDLAVEHAVRAARSMSPSHAATTTVATQLPIRLPSARAMPMNQSTDSTSTRPIAGIAGIAESVAASTTIAEPGTPCAPFDVTSEIAEDDQQVAHRRAACWSPAR